MGMEIGEELGLDSIITSLAGWWTSSQWPQL
jgi:hypothetical protein